MNNNKSIKIYKKNIFSSLICFFKGLINKSSVKSEQEIKEGVSNIQDVAFMEELQFNLKDVLPTDLQIKFENNEIDLDTMSSEEVHALNEAYKKQIKSLKQQIRDKQEELNRLKNANSSEN